MSRRPARSPAQAQAPAAERGAAIELEIDGVVVRVGRDADAGAIAAVIGALRGGS